MERNTVCIVTLTFKKLKKPAGFFIAALFVNALLMQLIITGFWRLKNFLFMPEVAVFREEHFNAAHRLFVPHWSDEKNNEVFGKCSLPNYHGHNYKLIVKVTGEPDSVTGFVMDLKTLSSLIQKEVLLRFDHKNLNLDTEEFRHLNPTAENIAITIYNLLRSKIDEHLGLKITLYETERNCVEYPA